MTWYAHEILLRATPAALQAIRDSALLAPFAYHLHSLQDVDWYLPGHRHGLPQGGLLVIRPVCSAAAQGAQWHEEAILDTTSLPLNPDTLHCLQADIATLLADQVPETSLPAPHLRSMLAALAEQLHETVVYYACGMWGGDLDFEYCLSYEPQETLWVTDVAERGPHEKRALYQALMNIGLMLPSAFFAPHTRSFDWAAHRLT
ncbi:MAG: hypothetical protein LBE30_08020 [Comamonas sp.]|jgi:hypothetical protein|nr:hypothetical protein [Comamonas sp.]